MAGELLIQTGPGSQYISETPITPTVIPAGATVSTVALPAPIVATPTAVEPTGIQTPVASNPTVIQPQTALPWRGLTQPQATISQAEYPIVVSPSPPGSSLPVVGTGSQPTEQPTLYAPTVNREIAELHKMQDYLATYKNPNPVSGPTVNALATGRAAFESAGIGETVTGGFAAEAPQADTPSGSFGGTLVFLAALGLIGLMVVKRAA